MYQSRLREFTSASQAALLLLFLRLPMLTVDLALEFQMERLRMERMQ
jgi:hypothetical protein